MDESFDAFFKFYEDAEVGDIGDDAFNDGPGRIVIVGGLPWVRSKLLDTQREALVFLVDLQDNRLNGLAFGIFLGWMLDPLGPGEIRDVDQAVDALFYADKDTEISDIFNLSFDDGTYRIGLGDQIPGVGLQLFHAQRDAFGLGLDIEDHDLQLIADGNHLGWMTGLLGPGHLGDVDQAFDALFQFDEDTVIGNGNDLALGVLADGIAVDDGSPRILAQLFDTQGDAVVLLVVL